MFRLLAILFALYFSSKRDGALGFVMKESGEDIPANNNINRPALILGEGNAERKDASAFEAEKIPGAEGFTGTSGTEPTLQPRGPKDDKGKGKMALGKSAKTSRSKDPEDSDSSGDERRRRARGRERQLSINIRQVQSSQLQQDKDYAKTLILDAKDRLSRPHADPVNNGYLTHLLIGGVRRYNRAHGRDWPDMWTIFEYDREYGMSLLLTEFKKIVEFIEAPGTPDAELRRSGQSGGSSGSVKGKGDGSSSSKRRPSR